MIDENSTKFQAETVVMKCLKDKLTKLERTIMVNKKFMVKDEK